MSDLQYVELRLQRKKKRDTRKKEWTPEMLKKLYELFPVSYNKQLAADLGVSWRTLVRKARELGIEKEPGFLPLRRNEITAMATKAKPANKYKGVKGWSVPGSEMYRFKPGHVPATKTNPDLVKRIHEARNETIRRDRIRRKIGLSPLTKFKNL